MYTTNTENRRQPNRLLALVVFGALSFGAAAPAVAGSCGIGKITHINEGGYNFQGLALRIDYSGQASAHPGTRTNGYIRFDPSLGADRLNALRSLAMMGLASGLTVRVYAPGGSCSEAAEIELTP